MLRTYTKPRDITLDVFVTCLKLCNILYLFITTTYHADCTSSNQNIMSIPNKQNACKSISKCNGREWQVNCRRMSLYQWRSYGYIITRLLSL